MCHEQEMQSLFVAQQSTSLSTDRLKQHFQRTAVHFAKQFACYLPDFASFSQSDQSALIQNASVLFGSVLLTYYNSLDKQEYSFAGLAIRRDDCKQLCPDWFAHLNHLQPKLDQLYSDSKTLACFLALLLLSDTCGLSNAIEVENKHKQLISCLNDYLTYDLNARQFDFNLTKLLGLLTEFRHLSAKFESN